MRTKAAREQRTEPHRPPPAWRVKDTEHRPEALARWVASAQRGTLAFLDGNDGLAEVGDALRELVVGHAVFFVAEGEMGLVGMGGFKTRTDLLQSTALVVNDGARISPAPDSAIHPDLRVFLEMMKPVMKSQLGNFGDAMEAIVFRIPLTEGQDILLSGGSKGRIRIAISGEEFAWRLPLGSLLPPAMDSETGEQFPGNFLFNPFTGRKLVVR